MQSNKDHDYLKICAEIASFLSISLSAARKKVEIIAAREGKKDILSRKKLAIEFLEKAKSNSKDSLYSSSAQLDKLLKALEEEENFMLED